LPFSSKVRDLEKAALLPEAGMQRDRPIAAAIIMLERGMVFESFLWLRPRSRWTAG